MFALYIVTSVLLSLFLSTHSYNADPLPSEVRMEPVVPSSPYASPLNIVPILFLAVCWKILARIGDDAGQVFIKRWIWGVIGSLCCLALRTLIHQDIIIFFLASLMMLYQLSGIFILAENHPEWKNHLINLGASYLFTGIVAATATPSTTLLMLPFLMWTMFLLTKIIRSNIFSPNATGRIGTARKPAITPGVIGAMGFYAILSIAYLIV